VALATVTGVIALVIRLIDNRRMQAAARNVG
jgi:hypothetical protein